MSVDLYVESVESGEELHALNFLRNPFGIDRWLEVNMLDYRLYWMLKKFDNAEMRTIDMRKQLRQHAAEVWQYISQLTKGVFEMALDWSWKWPMSNTPCLWWMADQNPWLWDHMEIVGCTPRKVPTGLTLPPSYHNSDSETTIRVDHDKFMAALPSTEEQFFQTSSFAHYQKWTKKLCVLACSAAMPANKLIISN